MKRFGLVLLASGLILGGSAEAGNIKVEWTGGIGVTVKFDATTINTQAGDFKLTVLDTSLEPDLLKSQVFYTFCVDLQHYSTSPVTATLDRMSHWAIGSYPHAGNTEGRARASYLGNRYFQLFQTGASNAVAAAYQLAIWELLYESTNSFGTTTGTTKFSNIASSVLTDANSLIAASGFSDAGWLKTANSGNYAQDFMAPVPEPMSSLSALAIGLLSLIGFARRQARR